MLSLKFHASTLNRCYQIAQDYWVQKHSNHQTVGENGKCLNYIWSDVFELGNIYNFTGT